MEHMTMAARLTHIALHVDAIDEGVEFYQRYCGLKVIDDQVRGGRRMVLLSEPGREAHLVLQLIAGGKDRAATADDDRHLGFAVDSREEVDRCVVMAKEDDILVFDIFEGPFPIGYVCGVKDPNGNTVEISCGHLLEAEAQ
jgi:catechol 2,3-dioxygenase-like lactoylglutathione lyase family enzyme